MRRRYGFLIVLASASLFALANFAAAQERDVPRTLVVGHRGLLYSAPENTLAGFKACLALRVGFEFDVRRAKGGELVCVHDATVERTTSGQGRVSELPLDELRRLDAGAWFAARFREERVPTVAEIVALIAKEGADSTLIAVDLKDHGAGLEAEVVKLAVEHKILERLVFIGATIESEEIRARLRAASAEAQTARLAKTPEEIAAVLADDNANWVYVRFLPSREDVARIHRRGKRIFIAGSLVASREAGNWKEAAELGIDAVLTDYPLELAAQLRAPR